MSNAVEYLYQVAANNSVGSTTSSWTVARTLPGGKVCPQRGVYLGGPYAWPLSIENNFNKNRKLNRQRKRVGQALGKISLL